MPFYLKSLLFIVSVVATLPIHASEKIEEIIVYSTLDQRTINQLAASISLWDSEAINTRNAQHIDQLIGTAPNVNFSGGASRGRFIQIRGIGDIEQFVDPKAYPSVGLVVDGIELNGLFGAGLLFDTEQVEILRGPQGTRFGASALAGAINIVSTQPSEQREGYIEAGAGKFNARQTAVALGGAMTDNITGRMSIQQYRSDGYIENEFLGRDDTGNFDEFIAKSKILWQINKGNSLNLVLLHIDNDNGYDGFSLKNTSNRTQSDQPGDDNQRVAAASVTHKINFSSNNNLETKFSFLKANTLYSFDEDWTDTTNCAPAFFCNFDSYRRDKNEYTLDVRYIFNEFVFGLYYQNSTTDLDRNRIGSIALDFTSQYKTNRHAVYSQWSPALSSNTNASLGLRLEKFEDSYSDTASILSDEDDNLWSIDASLNHKLGNNHQIYALISRGNKAGGVNTDATSNVSAIDPIFQAELIDRLRYESESLTNVELGTKTTFLNHSLNIDITAFYNKRNNPQFETFVYDGLTSFAFVGYQDNADSAHSHGLEVQMSYTPTTQLNFAGSISYIDSSIKDFRVYDFDLASYISISEKDQPRQSGYQYHLSSTLSITDKFSTQIQFEGRDSYQFAYYFDRESGNINLVHANTSYNHNSLSITLWIRNIFDEEYPVQGLYFANDPADGFTINRLYTQNGEPRNFGASMKYKF